MKANKLGEGLSVVLIFRKPMAGYYSIERVFNVLADAMREKVAVTSKYLPSTRPFPFGIVLNLLAPVKRADIYHVTGDVHYKVLAYPRKRAVLTIHDCRFLNQRFWLKKFLMGWFWLSLPVRRAAVVTVVSEETKKEVLRYSGCPHEKVIVIPNPIDPRFVFSPQSFRKERPRLLQIGTNPNKNLYNVVLAIKDLPFELTVVGMLSEESVSHLKSNAITYSNLVNVSDRELIEAYKSCDVLLYASTYEGFGLPVIEAQAIGRAVVTSRISPMTEISGGFAAFADPSSPGSIRSVLLKVISDDGFRESLIKGGRQNVKRFSASAIAEQYVNLYNSIASQT